MRAFARFLALLSVLVLATTTSPALPSATDISAAFQALDENANGAIGTAEWEKASFALFRSYDKNNDNALELPEVLHENLASSTFVRVDENGDRRVDIDEYMRLRRAIFSTADIDRTESIDAVEFELLRLLGEVGWTDKNKNRRIEFSELQASLVTLFKQADLNQDGRLTDDEASFLPTTEFQAIAKDNSVDLDTLVASYKRRLLSL